MDKNALKARLRDEQTARMTADGVLPVRAKPSFRPKNGAVADPIMAHYKKMLELGVLVRNQFDVADVTAVVRAWRDAADAVVRGDIAVSEREKQNWYEHRDFSEVFLEFVLACNGLGPTGALESGE